MTTEWITSDLHFFHNKIRTFCPETRPWETKEEMTESLISEWNEKVRPEDTIYHLGDFSFGKRNATEEVLNRLNGNKIFLLGNHDLSFEKVYAEHASVHHYMTFKRNHTRVVLFHYPIASWHSKQHGAIHLHGHLHGNTKGVHVPAGERMLDVGYDSVGEIITLEEALEIAADQ